MSLMLAWNRSIITCRGPTQSSLTAAMTCGVALGTGSLLFGPRASMQDSYLSRKWLGWRWCRRPDSNRHGVAPGDFESYRSRFGNQLVLKDLRCISSSASGFRRQIDFILFESALVFFRLF